MLRVRDITLLPGQGEEILYNKVAKILHLSVKEVKSLTISKKSIDARRKPDVRFIYTVDVEINPLKRGYCTPKDPKITLFVPEKYTPPGQKNSEKRPVIVGFGPAGMFAGLILAKAGLCPIILERGENVDIRDEKVRNFWNGGKLDPECNVQFGEGGAGTFSDGKLNSGVNNVRIAWILGEFVRFGADPSILYDAKPHIGTDILKKVVKNLRNEIISLGGEVRFGAKLVGLEVQKGTITGAKVHYNGTESTISCDHLILAIGHSARDTFSMLHDRNVPMEPKAFSMGVRIEHPQKKINISQYGEDNPLLPAADYKLNVHLPDGNSAYTFCMCPGGYVVAAASEEGGVVTNGMSNRARDGENANSALLVTLLPEDFPDKSTLGGMHWQREIEQTCFKAGGSNYHAPAQTVGSFLGTDTSPGLKPTYAPGVTFCDLRKVLPRKITDVMEKALPELGKRLRGFDASDAVMTAPETRSSSPVRILRDETRQSAIRGLYPCGEGAGYAGGITSAAVDGILCAEALMENL